MDFFQFLAKAKAPNNNLFQFRAKAITCFQNFCMLVYHFFFSTAINIGITISQYSIRETNKNHVFDFKIKSDSLQWQKFSKLQIFEKLMPLPKRRRFWFHFMKSKPVFLRLSLKNFACRTITQIFPIYVISLKTSSFYTVLSL